MAGDLEWDFRLEVLRVLLAAPVVQLLVIKASRVKVPVAEQAAVLVVGAAVERGALVSQAATGGSP
jgi:hypothetical protein